MKTLVKPGSSKLAVEEARRKKMRLQHLSPNMRKFARSLGTPNSKLPVEEARRKKMRLQHLSPNMRKFARSLGTPKQNLAK